MTIDDLLSSLEPDAIGRGIYRLIEKLFPICRSITGNGLRETLNIIHERVPIEIHEVPTGTLVFDWTIPKEWNIRDAYVKDSKGRKILDFNRTNLHILNYSTPIKKTMSLEELKPHLFTLPEHPNWIPYRTSYYKDNWGFCLSHNQFLSIEDGEYEVHIDSTLHDGHLTYGEFLIHGDLDDEILISTHVCHPSLANDNLSGICLSAVLAQALQPLTLRYSYRFLFIPGTIGAITWLFFNCKNVAKIKHGLVLTGLGNPGDITYKKSRRGDAEIDRAAQHVLKHSGQGYNVIDFYPYGYDERQYCSPGFNLPFGRLSRTPYGQYPEYHTSADNLEFVRPELLGDSYSKVLAIFHLLENNRKYENLNPMCEPQLGKRGLYSSIGGNELAMLWVLNLSDGQNSLLDIAERSSFDFRSICSAATRLVESNLLEESSN